MNLAQLKAKGVCVDPAPVRRSITWKHKNEAGEEISDKFDVWITRVSFGVIDRLKAADDSERSRHAELIAASVRLGDKADEEIPYDVAYSFAPGFALELVRAIGEVNRLRPEDITGPKG
jgi:hypothetical protein